MLDRTLTLTDLTLFGVTSIVGSGGFNLVGKVMRTGGSSWFLGFFISAVLLMGASYAYSEAFAFSGKNTAESDLVASVFGPVGEGVSVISILLFNIVSVTAILVFCAHLLAPTSSWLVQVGIALAALGGMAGFSLGGIELNKVTINAIAYILVGVLVMAGGLGVYDLAVEGPVTLPPSTSFTTSLLMMFFILAGFDSNMKFAGEAADPADIPRSFYSSNIIAILLMAGLALAIQQWLPVLSVAKESNAIGHLFSVFAGSWIAEPTKYLMISFMLTTTFIVFLSTTRYLFGLGEKFSALAPLKELNSASVPYITVFLVAAIIGLAILINCTESLVRISDVGVIGLLGLVAAAAAVMDWGEGSLLSAALNGATATGFAGMLGICLL